VHPPPTPLAQALDLVGTTVVDAVGPSDLIRPTPCDGWDVRQVLAHIVGTTIKFTAFARQETERPSSPRGDPLGDDIRQAYWDAAAASAAAWALPVPDRAICRLPFGDFPGEYAARINLFDVLVHGWDLASAVGLTYTPPTPLVVMALEVAERLVTPVAVATGQYRAPTERGTAEVGHAAATSPMPRLLRLTGRQADRS
jgi:uncharacterized protein (TIGR03086 family)